MKRGLATLGDILGIKLKLPAQPVPLSEPEIRAPMPTPPKVVGDPTWTPVNKQAAMLLSRAEPMPPEAPKQSEVPRLREENAKLKATNDCLVDENCALRRRVKHLEMLLQRRQKPTVTIPNPVRLEPNPEPEKQKLLERLTHDV